MIGRESALRESGFDGRPLAAYLLWAAIGCVVAFVVSEFVAADLLDDQLRIKIPGTGIVCFVMYEDGGRGQFILLGSYSSALGHFLRRRFGWQLASVGSLSVSLLSSVPWILGHPRGDAMYVRVLLVGLSGGAMVGVILCSAQSILVTAG